MKKEVNDDCITLALYFLFHAGWQRCATCHVKQNLMDAITGRELVIYWRETLRLRSLLSSPSTPLILLQPAPSRGSLIPVGDAHLHLHVICLANHASVAGFIVDFYCHKAGLVVEVDGDIHDLQQEEDARREKILREMGLRIVRFQNEEVVRDLSAVVGKIREVIGVFLFTSSNRGKI